MFKRLAFILLSLLILPAHGQDSRALEEYYQSVHTLRGEFEQVTKSDTGKVIETSHGTMLIQRPDRFRWSYESPFEQLIVADGSRLWVYDVDLEQVTVRPLSEVLGVGPALLLSGDYKDLQNNFAIRQEQEGWLRLIPKQDDWDFQAILLLMEGGVPRVIEVDSGLGQMTRLELSKLERNVRIDPAQFQFTPPPGVDVITTRED